LPLVSTALSSGLTLMGPDALTGAGGAPPVAFSAGAAVSIWFWVRVYAAEQAGA
jgi:hypothetical protein